MSLPAQGAWIELPTGLSLSLAVFVAPRTGERGLKHKILEDC